MAHTEYIESIELDEACIISRSQEVENERAAAIRDLLEENFFAPSLTNSGPYNLRLSVADNRLHFGINDSDDNQHNETLALQPFKRIIKDYFLICESYFEAIKSANSYKVEAVDMGRRGIHNEGSTLLKELLHDKIRIDFETARRLFTLICVLHIRNH